MTSGASQGKGGYLMGLALALPVLILAVFFYLSGSQDPDDGGTRRLGTARVSSPTLPERLEQYTLADNSAKAPDSPPSAASAPTPIFAHTPQYRPRPESEWQGMPVDETIRVPCRQSGICSMALACLSDGRCGACSADSDCAGGEKCVLDRCLLQDLVKCTTASDCPEGELCVLTGLGGGDKNNKGLRSLCSGERRAPLQTREELAPELFVGGETVYTKIVEDLSKRVLQEQAQE